MRKGKITIVDIARLARVSTTTVSRVINNQSVHKKTKERVVKVMEKYEYSPNRFAQYLGQRSKNKIHPKNGTVTNKSA